MLLLITMRMRFILGIISVVFLFLLIDKEIYGKDEGPIWPAHGCSFIQRNATSVSSSDYSRHQAASQFECEAVCGADEKCGSYAFSWLINRPNCFLQMSTPKLIAKLTDIPEELWVRTSTYSNSGYKNCEATLPTINCTSTYRVEHNRKYPKHHNIFIFWAENENILSRARCQSYCDAWTTCHSVTYMSMTQFRGTTFCYLNNITLQELEATSSFDVGTNNNATEYPVYITFDRACECVPGYEPDEVSTGYQCQPCNRNHYKLQTANDRCDQCPSERPHTSMRGAVSKDSCTNLFCPPGEGLDGKVCKSCTESQVSSNGTDPCKDGNEGEVPNHDQSEFICSAGYERNKTEGQCQKCHEGYFKSENGDGQCRICPPNTVTTKPGATACVEDDGIYMEILIGVVVGGAVVLAAAGLAVYLCWRKLGKRSKQTPATSSEETDSYSYSDVNGSSSLSPGNTNEDETWDREGDEGWE